MNRRQFIGSTAAVGYAPLAFAEGAPLLFNEITGHAFAHVPSFEDQLRRGVPYWRARLDAASGIDVHGHNGIAVGDIDNDGLDEIYICQPGGLPNRLYRNNGQGQFEDITERAGLAILDATSSALFLDLRNSGHQDLVVLRPEGPLLFLNDGSGLFTHKPGAFRFRTPPQGSFTGMAAADYDRDSRIDLYLCTYSFFRDGNQYRYPTPYYDAQNGPANFLFHNEGDAVFVDATSETGIDHNNNRFSFAPAWCDYDADGWPDLYVANDFGRKNLYKNDHGRFRDVAAEAGVEDYGDGMSAAWFDYDGDGRPDLYVSNLWSAIGQRVVAELKLEPADPWRRHAKGNSLYRNRGNGTFEETGPREGVEMGRWAWSSDGIDFDNDGTPEIFITCGMLTNASETDLEEFFWRKVASMPPGPAYENGWNELSKAVHEKFSEAGRQPNAFYVRRDGRYHDYSGVSGLDFADDSRAFAVLDLDGDGNLDLIVKNRLGPQVRVFQNNCAGRKSIAFRLRGVDSNRDAIGARVEVDRQVKFVSAGSGYLSQHTKILYFGIEAARRVRITWPSGTHQEFLDLEPGNLYEIHEGGSPRPRPFRPRTELPATPVYGENEARYADTRFLTPVPLPEATPAGIIRLSNLSKERAAQYAIFCRYLFDLHANITLPIWFLVDEQSRARKIYFAPPDSSAEPAVFGRYYTPPERNYTSLGAAFAAAGFPESALRYLEFAPQDSAVVLIAIGKIHLDAKRWERARASLQKAVRFSPESADAWNTLGAIELGSGAPRAAIPHFKKAIELKRDYVPAINNLAGAYASVGQLDDAIAALRYGIGAAPNEETLRQNLEILEQRK
ncbi:MAG: VCBS repeat-containing protein [Acidobacteriota bacterium]|nr:VCBS repeat-containing protein [Acidobacteriota bacterium]